MAAMRHWKLLVPTTATGSTRSFSWGREGTGSLPMDYLGLKMRQIKDTYKFRAKRNEKSHSPREAIFACA